MREAWAWFALIKEADFFYFLVAARCYNTTSSGASCNVVFWRTVQHLYTLFLEDSNVRTFKMVNH